jgi:hypothetical protein
MECDFSLCWIRGSRGGSLRLAIAIWNQQGLGPHQVSHYEQTCTQLFMKYHSALEFSWDEICNLFEGIYVNWDPGLFQHRLEFHGYCCSSSNFLGDVLICHLSRVLFSIWKAKNAEDKELCKFIHLSHLLKLDAFGLLQRQIAT